ncbi:hypothetical protein OG21DRAFT_1485005 [Imleria badia]|nr:hypothetical protein OG21DRAFT_1485005 [Imleria badia]
MPRDEFDPLYTSSIALRPVCSFPPPFIFDPFEEPSSSIDMSARQTFIPRPPSRVVSSEPHPHSTDVRAREDNDMIVDGNGKARSVAAFFGQKRGTGTDTASQGTGPQGPGLGRANASTNRRSFEGILRPEMVPMSIIPYPATTQLGAGMKQPGAGQTPRKTTGPGAFEFPSPMTPVSVPRGFKKGFRKNREDEATSNGNAHGSGVVFMAPEGGAEVRAGTGTGIGAYMRVFEGSGSGGSAGGLQSTLDRDIVAPVPAYALGGFGENPEDEGCEIDDIFARSSRSFGAMAEEEVGTEKSNDTQRSFGGTKRGMRREDMEESGRYADEGREAQGSAKRTKQVQHDPNEYFPISSPHAPPTPGPSTPSVNMLDPAMVVGSLLEDMEEFISLEEIEADWKRWRESTTEEWLKGADELAKDYGDILNMVKDHLTEKVMAYASMVSSVEERRTEVNRSIEVIHGKGNIVRENISKLGTKM